MVWKNDQVSKLETDKIIEIAKRQIDIPGDFVELGCYKGDTSLLLADVLKSSDKKLWIYDSFEGLPEKGAEDLSVMGENFKSGELSVTKREVKETVIPLGILIKNKAEIIYTLNITLENLVEYIDKKLLYGSFICSRSR